MLPMHRSLSETLLKSIGTLKEDFWRISVARFKKTADAKNNFNNIGGKEEIVSSYTTKIFQMPTKSDRPKKCDGR